MEDINTKKLLDFEEAWKCIEVEISKFEAYLEGECALTTPFNMEEIVVVLDTVYDMCTKRYPDDYCSEQFSKRLYGKYKLVLTDYISSTVLPSLRSTPDSLLLAQFVRRWENHKVMVRWLSRFFHFLDLYYVPVSGSATLSEVGRQCFSELVYDEIGGRVFNLIDNSSFKRLSDVLAEMGVDCADYVSKSFNLIRI